MLPSSLQWLSIGSLLPGGGCAFVLAVDEKRHPQKMSIMNVVWPVTAVFSSVSALWGYIRYRHLAARDGVEDHAAATPYPTMVGKGTSHCGAGCTLGYNRKDLDCSGLCF